MDTSGYQVSGLEDIEIQWEYPGLTVDAVLWPGIDTPFSPSSFNNSEKGSLAENPVLIDEDQDKDYSPLLPRTPVAGKPKHPLCCRKVTHLEQEWRMILIMCIEICLKNF